MTVWDFDKAIISLCAAIRKSFSQQSPQPFDFQLWLLCNEESFKLLKLLDENLENSCQFTIGQLISVLICILKRHPLHEHHCAIFDKSDKDSIQHPLHGHHCAITDKSDKSDKDSSRSELISNRSCASISNLILVLNEFSSAIPKPVLEVIVESFLRYIKANFYLIFLSNV
jgi:hypothetical protein